MNRAYTEQAQIALDAAVVTAKQKKSNYVGTEHLLLGLLASGRGAASVLLREHGVHMSKLQAMVDQLISPVDAVPAVGTPAFTPRAEKVLVAAAEDVAARREKEIGTEHILLAILRDSDCVAARLLFTLDVDMQKLYEGVLRSMGVSESQIDAEVQAFSAGAGEASGTPTLDQFGRDLTRLAADGRLDPVIGREREIGRLMEILNRRTKNNPCLIGEPGVGKTAIVEGLALRIAQDLVPESMKARRVVTLDLSGMVAGTKYRGEFEERIKRVIREVSEGSGIVLFIDEIHTIIGAGGAEGALDASNILKPSLSRGEIQLIGATTIDEYRKHIEKDAALERRFQPITVDEPDEEETIDILKGLRPYYEEHHGVTIPDETLQTAVRLGKRYLNDRCFPDKAIDLIDETSSRVQLSGYRAPEAALRIDARLREIAVEKEQAIRAGHIDQAGVLQGEQEKLLRRRENAVKRSDTEAGVKALTVEPEHIARTVASWTKIPVEKIAEGESKRLARLEQELHRRVVGQEEAVGAVAKAIKRGRVGLADPNRPIGSFLFLGPTGVGKTELSKALAEAVFGSEDNMIRVDMSEYMEKHSVSKLIGSPPGYVGYDEGGQLSEKVRRNPYSVLLFDEIEKAHPDVFNILLQVLDDGHITDAQGRKVSFKETCIIMTSNAGAASIVNPKRLGFLSEEDEKRDYEHMKGQVMEEVRRMFKPEFLNRIDEIIVFHSLTKTDMKKIVDIQIADLVRRCREQMEIELKVSAAAKNDLIEKSFDSKYGARPLKRAIQTRLEDVLAEKILAGEVKRGETVKVGISFLAEGKCQ